MTDTQERVHAVLVRDLEVALNAACRSPFWSEEERKGAAALYDAVVPEAAKISSTAALQKQLDMAVEALDILIDVQTALAVKNEYLPYATVGSFCTSSTQFKRMSDWLQANQDALAAIKEQGA